MTDLVRLPSGEYRWNGRTIPGVTRVLALLRPYAGVPQETLAFAQQRGKAAHACIHLLEGGRDGSGLHWPSVHSHVEPYVRAWEKCKADIRWITTATERPAVSSTYAYACTPDLFGTMRGIPAVIDCKTGASPLVPLQLAAQAQALKETRRWKQKPRRYSLSLKATGEYALKEWKDASDLPSFLACLQLYQWISRFQARLIPAEAEPTYENFEEIFP